MLGIIKVSLHKNTRPISGKNEKKSKGRLPVKLLEYLESKYLLCPREMLRLRVVQSRGFLGNRAACFIRIYDQEASVRNGIFIRTYEDLDTRPDLILYNGYILEDNFVYITKCDTNILYRTS